MLKRCSDEHMTWATWYVSLDVVIYIPSLLCHMTCRLIYFSITEHIWHTNLKSNEPENSPNLYEWYFIPFILAFWKTNPLRVFFFCTSIASRQALSGKVSRSPLYCSAILVCSVPSCICVKWRFEELPKCPFLSSFCEVGKPFHSTLLLSSS